MTGSEFARLAPVGTLVRYYPAVKVGRHDEADQFVETRIRSEPWTLGHGDVVVCLEGYSGGKSIKHIMVPEPSNA